MSGVAVTLSGGQSLTMTTDTSGNYVFNAVVSLNNYTVTPSKTGFGLTPANAQFTSLLSNQAGVNFTARASLTTLNPSADVYVFDGNTNTNFGTNAQLITRLKSGGNYQTYLKFDLSNFCGATKVLLRGYGRLSDNKAASVPLNVYQVSVTNWAETARTWTNKPADTGVVLQSVPVVGTTAKWYDLDITTYVKSELSASSASPSRTAPRRTPRKFSSTRARPPTKPNSSSPHPRRASRKDEGGRMKAELIVLHSRSLILPPSCFRLAFRIC
ncbi:MAG TPA: DNRLRE domain-containing protein [Pyrinomonadaceae bacterium]|jgi:hypothetical protein|nr:DNRLRE domain-containing protein [Pyrinomonadaceae bacterium]